MVAVSVVIGFAVAGAVAFVSFDSFAVVKFLVFALLTVVFALVFVAIAVGFSARVRSTSQALYGSFGLFVLFQFVWGFVPLVLRYAINEFLLPNLSRTPQWAVFISSVNPQVTYSHAATALLPDLGHGSVNASIFHLQDWFGFIILVFWLIVPVGLGYVRFNGADL